MSVYEALICFIVFDICAYFAFYRHEVDFLTKKQRLRMEELERQLRPPVPTKPILRLVK